MRKSHALQKNLRLCCNGMNTNENREIIFRVQGLHLEWSDTPIEI